MRRTASLFLLTILLVVTASAHAMQPVFLRDFKLHDFDDDILGSLGHTAASVLYFREMGALTETQSRTKRQYEAIGCNPYYVMLNGKIEESGYNCRSFFCVGYTKGPRQCKDVNGKAYGGVVEINNRLSLVTISDIRKPFKDYAVEDRTDYMRRKLAEMEPIRCTPFYLQEFDVVVGEGYDCAELGRYPNYSGKFNCVDDFRKQDGLVCNITLRKDEMEIRTSIAASLGYISSSSSSSSSVASSSVSSVSSSAMSSAASSPLPRKLFPDVVEGKYGFTAIVTLGGLGIIKGYPDGSFKPNRTVNRAEFMQLLVRGLHADAIEPGGSCFPDVQEQWFSPVVCAGRRLKWVTGYKDGLFHPERTMKKSEALKIIIVALGKPLASAADLPPGVPDNEWYSPYVRKAVELGILLETSFQPTADVTRADAAVWMYRSAKAAGKI